MCRRILNLQDNKLYSYAEIGTRLNDYFAKNNINAKNKHYELHKFWDICKAEGLGPGKHKGFELIPIIQREIERVKASQANVKPRKVNTKPEKLTPIEAMAAETKEEPKAEPVPAVAEETTNLEPGDFEAKRKKFYTDFHYFVKFCPTAEERAAMLKALAALYGFPTQKEGEAWKI